MARDPKASARKSSLRKSAERVLAVAAAAFPQAVPAAAVSADAAAARDLADLVAADLVERARDGAVAVTAAGRAHLARRAIARAGGGIDPYLGQHLAIARRTVNGPAGPAGATVDDAESPLAWLARRKGRDGQPLIAPAQLQAGERLRAEFTVAQLMPRITSNWQASVSHAARAAAGGGNIADAIIAARQRVRLALDAAGPEFSGILVDVCCFLKGLEDIERERLWPSRSAKVVLQLGLDRLARHYGLAAQAHGRAHGTVATWLAPGAAFAVDGVE